MGPALKGHNLPAMYCRLFTFQMVKPVLNISIPYTPLTNRWG